MTVYNFISFCGIFGLMAVGWLFSNNRRVVNWRVVFWGVLLQLIVGVFVFHWPPAVAVFHWLNGAVIKLFSFAQAGIYFLFGALAVQPGQTGPMNESSVGFILAIQILPSVIFFSVLMSLLYYIRLMPLIIRSFSFVFTKLMKISGAESLCTAANIFVGVESTFTIRPYLEKMTRSELCTVLTAGMATIASTVLAFYTAILHEQFPLIAGHLISASLMSAPAAIIMSKLIFPETEKPLTLGTVVSGEVMGTEDHPAGLPAEAALSDATQAGWIEAVIKGAEEGFKLLVGIIVLLIAFLGLLALVNWVISLLGGGWSLEKILGYIFYPLVWLMGVQPEDIQVVSELVGQRTIVTELVSYQALAEYIKQGVLQPRSVVITTYALCGFAHIASLAIFVGGISALVPSRRRDLARLGFRALVAATLACLMTGAVAGVFTPLEIAQR